MSFFYPYFSKYKRNVYLALTCVLFAVICEVLQPIIMSKIIDVGIPNMDFKYILGFGTLMVLLAVLCLSLGIGNIYQSAISSQGFAAELRKALFTKIQQFTFNNMNEFSTSSLITRLTNDVNTLQMTLLMSMRLLVRAPITLVFASVVIISIDAKLAMIVLCTLPVFIAIVMFIGYKAMPRFMQMQNALDKMNVAVQEDLTNIRLIKSFVREDFEQQRFNIIADELKQKTMNAFYIAIMIMPIMILILNSVTLIVWWQGGTRFIANELDIGKLSAFITYIFVILFSIMMISFVLLMLVRSRASMNRIKEVLQTEISMINNNGAMPKDITSLRFENVCFKFEDTAEEYILQDINFEVKANQVVGIIGSTSSGKSSLVQLIPRFFDVLSGKIFINGEDITKFDIKKLRMAIGFVMQKNVLFTGTIAENIRWGKSNASDDEVIEACKKAQAHDFIMSFPEQYNTMIGQNGVNVSGGQRQRLCIARATIKSPQILILDDSTSAIDSTTESKIYDAFKTINAMKIIIAQRISSIKHADKIIVLDNGKIVGYATHDELMKENAVYQEIFESQNRALK